MFTDRLLQTIQVIAVLTAEEVLIAILLAEVIVAAAVAPVLDHIPDRAEVAPEAQALPEVVAPAAEGDNNKFICNESSPHPKQTC